MRSRIRRKHRHVVLLCYKKFRISSKNLLIHLTAFIPNLFRPSGGVLFVERAIPKSFPPQPGCSVYSTLHSKWAMPVFFRIDRYIQNIPLRLKRFRDGPLYKQNALLGRKRFRDGPLYKQNAPLGRKRFRDGPFYKQNAPLGRTRFRDGPFYKQNATMGRKRFGIDAVRCMAIIRGCSKIL